ncbi:MAG: hypothetical protein IJT79_05270 [Ruminococcus sp.]|nr:hypothetical protein [Ruminococcus sp.]
MAEYSDSVYKYRIAMSTVSLLYRKGIVSEKEYVASDTIMAKKYGIYLDSIFRNKSPEPLDSVSLQS